jgi:mono/diheme cytochrome c family protein
MERRHIGVAAGLLGLLAVLPAAAQAQAITPAQKAAADSGDVTVVTGGRKIFHGKGTCYACHGPKLEGGPVAPSLKGGTWRHIEGTFESILTRVRTGYTGTAMVPYPGGINDAEAVEVATYIYAVSQGKAKP